MTEDVIKTKMFSRFLSSHPEKIVCRNASNIFIVLSCYERIKGLNVLLKKPKQLGETMIVYFGSYVIMDMNGNIIWFDENNIQKEGIFNVSKR